jgi:pyridoxamine 5'-phosphate oxidase
MTIALRDDPVELFNAWLHDAIDAEAHDPTAVCLATVAPDGMPSARMVLLKGADAQGFVFYTNFESRKGGEILANPKAALCFHWQSLRRQVRVEGPVEAVSEAEADAYFATRPRESQIGAWASLQSRPMEGMFALEKRVAAHVAKFAIGKVPRPPEWSGFRVQPVRIEFWKHGAFRMHDRLLYERVEHGGENGDAWRTARLYP